MKTLITLSLFFVTFYSSPQVLAPPPVNDSINRYDSLNINGVNARINNSGSLFWDMTWSSKYFVPNGSKKTSVFCFGIWAGGLDSNDSLHLAGDRYRSGGRDYWSGPVMDSAAYSYTQDTLWNKIWKINKSEIEYHKTHWWLSNYTVPKSILTWPGNGNTSLGEAAQLAPFKDINGNGIYEPMQGDYPLIKGDLAVFFIVNDDRDVHTETLGKKLRLEMHCMAYAFDCPQDSALWYTTFLHYDIYNRSANTYHDTYFGTFTDTDLGYAWDDYIGCDITRNSFYSYNGNQVDGLGQPNAYGAYPPAISTTILGGPFIDPDGLDNPKLDSLGAPLCDLSVNGVNFDDGIIDNERFGMSKFVYTNNSASGPTSDPSKAADYYMILNAYWKDGIHVKYGANGHPNSGSTLVDANFMFPDLSDPCNWGTNGIQPPGYTTGAGGSGPAWTEEEANNPPGDRRGLISMGPFTFLPNSKQQLDIAFVWARQYTDTLPAAAIPLLKTRIDQIRYDFNHDTTSCGGSFSGIQQKKPSVSSLKIYPNPATNYITVRYSSQVNTEYSIFSSIGLLVKHGNLIAGDKSVLSLEGMVPSLYILIIKDGERLKSARFIKN